MCMVGWGGDRRVQWWGRVPGVLFFGVGGWWGVHV